MDWDYSFPLQPGVYITLPSFLYPLPFALLSFTLHLLPLQCESPAQAVADLEKELGFELSVYAPGTTSVPDRLKLDMKKLKSYLNWALKLHDKGRRANKLKYNIR